MGYVRNGHVVGEIQRFVPINIAIQHSGPEALRARLTRVPVDLFGTPQELFPVSREMPVMI
jgi:hypothetical protein